MQLLFRPLVLADLRAFHGSERARAIAALRALVRRPEPDGISRVEAPEPFKAGTVIAMIGAFAIRYALRGDELEVFRVQRLRTDADG